MRRTGISLITGLTSLAMLAAAGCGRDHTDTVTVEQGALSATTARITIALPAGSGFSSVSVAAKDSLRIDDRARVQIASGAASGAVANSGTTLTNIGVESRTGTITSVAPVTLRDRSQITGNVVSSGAITPGSNVVVSGTQTPNTPLTFDRWSWSVSLPASGGPVSVPVNGSSSIAPGSYAGVQAFSGATLSVRAGTYFMDALTMEPQSRLAVDTRNGNVIIYMRTGFTFRGSTVFTGPNDRLLFVYLGTTQPGIDRSFDGTLVAQNASVRLGVGGSPYAGAVYAKSVELDPDVRYTVRTFAGWGTMPFSVEPRFNCLERRPGGAYVGNFGYRNPGSSNVTVALGANNQFSPGVPNRQQPTVFLPGTHDNEFAVTWVTHEASWFLNGMEARVDATKVCTGTSFAANADTSVTSSADRANFGTATTLDVGSGQHALVSFDRAAIASFLGANRFIKSAKLELTVSGAAPTTSLEVIAMRKGWTELGATWNCGNDTDATAAGEACDRAARWKMVRRDAGWENPWYRMAPGATGNVGVVSGGKVTFDVTSQAQQFLGTERINSAVSFIVQAVGATGLSGKLASREAGATVAPKLIIEPIGFTDYDVLTADDQHAPFSITVDPTVVATHAPVPSLTPGGADRPVAALQAADGTHVEFTDSELLVFTDSATELAAIQARLGATLLYQGQFTVPGMPRPNLIRINPATVSTANLVSSLTSKVPGLRGRQRASSDAAVRLLAAASDEVGRGSKVAMNWLMKPNALDVSSLSRSFVIDGASNVTDPFVCGSATSGICSSNDFDWTYYKPGMHNVTQAWKAYMYSGHFLDNIEVAILDAGFRHDKLDGLGNPPTPGCPSASCFALNDCGGENFCTYHGTAVANSAFAEPGNAYGGAGPGAPSIGNNLSLAYSAYDPATYIISGFGSIFSGTDILNMSYSGYIPDWAYALGAGPFLETQTEQFRLTGILQFASAGNDGINVDRMRCYTIKEPITDTIAGAFGGETPLQATVCPWEESFTWPCESWGVDCVEGTNMTDRGRHPDSNYGTDGGTQYKASFTSFMAGIDTADDSKFYAINGTSFSSPMVASMAQMTWMANPALSSWDVEDCLYKGGGGFVDAFASVKCAFGNPSNFIPTVQITSPADQKEIPPPPIGGVPTTAFLTAWADDVEDGQINAIDWKVNGVPAGNTASGGSIAWAIPGPGTFVAEAHVTDSGGAQYTASVTFYVSPTTPDIVIVKPPKGATRFQAIVGEPVQLFAQVPNRALAVCDSTAIKWTATLGGTPIFTDHTGCSLMESFTPATLPAIVTLTATFTEPTGSDSDSVEIEVIDDGKAHIQIRQPKISGFDGLIHVPVKTPVVLDAWSTRIPAGSAFTWTYQTGSDPLTIIGGSTANQTVTFPVEIPGKDCNSVPGTINVASFDELGMPVSDQIQVSFDDFSDCEPH